MPNTIPVFINGRRVTAPQGASLAEALGVHDPDLLALVLGGAIPTDARGLPVDPALPVVAGGIYRLQRSARSTNDSDA